MKHLKFVLVGLVGIVIGGAAAFAIFDYTTRCQCEPPTVANTPATGTTPLPQLFHDDAIGLFLPMPTGFTVSLNTANDVPYSYLPTLSESANATPTVRESLILDPAPYAGTNFSDASVAISAYSPVNNPSELDMCNMINSNGNILMAGTETINGLKWWTDTMSSAAAGTDVTTNIYHIVHNDTCVEVTLNLVEGNIGNWDPGTVKPVDDAAVMAKLHAVLDSLQFTR